MLSTKIQKIIYINNAIYHNELIFKIEETLLSIRHRDFERNKKHQKIFDSLISKVCFARLIRKILQIDSDKSDFRI